MAEKQEVSIPASDIESVAQKLEQFGKQLPPNEQLVINWLLERAGSAPAEDPEEMHVQGYLQSPGGGTFGGVQPPGTFSQAFDRALGLRQSEGTVVVGVGIRF